jgi:CheY-like chemotaxis protein
MTTIVEGTHVVVIDDEKAYAETTAGVVEEAGLIPTIISEGDGKFQRTQELLDRVLTAGCSAVICDHRLSHTPFASFSGAEFLANLYQQNIPGVLLSTYSALDDDCSIRLHRARIPSLISRSHLGPDQILQGLRRCEAELSGHIAPERQQRRTLVRVVEVSTEAGIPVADAIVHTWDPDLAVRFPISVIEDPQIRYSLKHNFSGVLRLFAKVNVGCQDASELFFKEFELAPEPNVDKLTR